MINDWYRDRGTGKGSNFAVAAVAPLIHDGTLQMKRKQQLLFLAPRLGHPPKSHNMDDRLQLVDSL